MLLAKAVLIRGTDPVTQQTYFVRIANNRCSMRYYAAALRRPHTAAFVRTGQSDSLRIARCEEGGSAPGTTILVYGRFNVAAGEHQRLSLRIFDHSPFRLYAAIYCADGQRTLDHHRSTLLLDARNLHRFRQFARWVAYVTGGEHTVALERAFSNLSSEAVSHGA